MAKRLLYSDGETPSVADGETPAVGDRLFILIKNALRVALLRYHQYLQKLFFIFNLDIVLFKNTFCQSY
ncbi:MAG TPA: hypothetical protein VK184_23400 [Nostocaceae cyanobacterium]|nr:hypothetical protein [Nostocaceae cyanobacterium]